MSRDLDLLVPEFKSIVLDVIASCQPFGVKMVPFFTERSTYEQAKLWRQGRSGAEIRQTIAWLREKGAHFIAHCIESVGPQKGDKIVTRALPGESWHQYGLAVDCYLSIGGKAIWDSSHPGYKVYADAARRFGLTAGLYFSFKDAPHIQMPKDGSPQMSWEEINKRMEDRYGSEYRKTA